MADDVVPVSFLPDRNAGNGGGPSSPSAPPRRPASPMSAAAAPAPDRAPVFRELPRRHSSASMNLDVLRDVELTVKIELGRTRMRLDDVLRLGQGSLVELDRLAGDPVDVFVNDRLVARGEVVVLNDNFAVRLT